MRAFTLDSFDASPAVRDDLPTPNPADDELLVGVQASAVNPVDAAIAAGQLKDMVEHEFPVVLGRVHAGVVEQVGAGVTRYAAGDEVSDSCSTPTRPCMREAGPSSSSCRRTTPSPAGR